MESHSENPHSMGVDKDESSIDTDFQFSVEGDCVRKNYDTIDMGLFVAERHQIIKGDGPGDGNKLNGLDYFLTLQENRKGHILTYLANLEELENEMPGAYKDLREMGLTVRNRIMIVHNFFPNGHYEEANPSMRKGVGTRAIEMLMNDARENNCDSIACATHSESLVAFLKKIGFQDKGYFFIKFLTN